MEAGSLPSRIPGLEDTAGVPVSYLITLFQDYSGAPPTPAVAEAYWEHICEPELPVMSDELVRTLQDTPYNGSPLPGKCVLTPAMEILHCYSGADDTSAFAAIREHAGL